MNPKQMIQSRSVQLIFRDCLKLANRMVTNPSQIQAVRKLIRSQFEKNKQQFDNDKILMLKMNAAKGISNYLVYLVQSEHKMFKKDDKQLKKSQQSQQSQQQKQYHEQRNIFDQKSHLKEQMQLQQQKQNQILKNSV